MGVKSPSAISMSSSPFPRNNEAVFRSMSPPDPRPAAGRRRPALNSGRCGSGVRKTLESLRGSCTLIVIAHRLSTIMSADQVLVVDQGRLVERGTPGELLAARGLFAQLYESQVLKAKADTGPEISV